MARGKQTGRIRPDQRDADDSVPILGSDIVIEEQHAAAVQETHSQGMKDKTRKEYRNRLQHLMTFWEQKYPAYWAIGTCDVTDDERNDLQRYYFKHKRDIIYSGLNVELVTAFLVQKKVKDNGNLISSNDLSKYNDAIKWGATCAGQRLPTSYYVAMEQFISSYKKEFAEAKKNGNVDEKAADPINASLFTLILQWALAEMNIFVWVFSLLMWHMMARSISISSLALHNIKRGVYDSIQFRYDNTKTDQTGEFVQTKNCYANPQTPHLCLYLALGCWLSINSESFASTEKLFVKNGKKNGSASQNYCRQLQALVGRHEEAAKKFLRFSRFHAHGIRKGSGTHASSATTLPPAFTSVAARGEWSMGKILDIYFQFAMGGDYYLGRLLTLIDPEDAFFNTLPPHWKNEEHPSIRRAIEITFGKVLSCHEEEEHNPIGLLTFLLASMVHHSDWLFEEMGKHPGHPFANIPILNEPDLLKELKEQHLTLEPTVAVQSATGIPPYVAQTKLLREVLDVCTLNKESLDEFRVQMNNELRNAVADAVDAKVSADGGVNQSIMQTQFSILRKELTQEFREIVGQAAMTSNTTRAEEATEIDTSIRTPSATEFQYVDNNGKMRYWPVPESFTFPVETKRWDGWRKWLCGQVFIDGSMSWKLGPFRDLTGRDLKSPSLQAALNNEWKPIFSRMMEAPNMPQIPRTEDINEEFIQSSYAIGTLYLKERFSYIFQTPLDALSKYTIGTWSKKVKTSEVMKHGSEEDKAKLPAPTAYNKSRRRKQTQVPTVQNQRRRLNKVRRANSTSVATVARTEQSEMV